MSEPFILYCTIQDYFAVVRMCCPHSSWSFCQEVVQCMPEPTLHIPQV